IWLHAASVGEVELIKPLVEFLHKDTPILVTTFTVTGYQHALRSLPAGVFIRALPIDLLPVSQRFIKLFNFKLALIAETELWPETLYQTSKKDISLIQLNARLSDKTLHTSGWIKNILKTTLGYFDSYLTRTEQDVNNLLAMGADKNRITVAGNLKYAHSPAETHYARLIQQPYILFASTHHPEEELFANLIKRLKLKKLIVIAPRHPYRAKEILKNLKSLGLNIKQRSQGEKLTTDTHIYLADTLGELKAFMAYAELVIMGGSFDNTGGHNVLEPARLGKAVITGPSDSNIQQDITLLLQHDAIIQVDGIDQLAENISLLLETPDSLQLLAKNAQKFMLSQSHILQNYLTEIKNYL
ncbi:MAG: hypothetical protein KAU21_13355, partial [Gammaproteobacteria bacterium]|nr:hypothetical protein [Gammaproteobacteria bacterium]